MNTNNLKAKLLLTYAHLGPEEAERRATRDVEAVQNYHKTLKYNIDWIKDQGGTVIKVEENTIQYTPKVEMPKWNIFKGLFK